MNPEKDGCEHDVLQEEPVHAPTGALDLPDNQETPDASALKGGDKVWIYAIRAVAVAFALFHVYTGIFGTIGSMPQRAVHLAFAGALTFFVYPFQSRDGKKQFHVLNSIMALCLVLPCGYLVLFEKEVTSRFYYVQPLTWYQYALFLMLVVGLLIGTYKIIGPSLPIIAGLSVLYALYGHLIPGFLNHGKFSLLYLVDVEYMTTEGIFGTALSASATFVVMFVIFGAFLSRSGVGDFFIDFATTITAKSTGGSAKAAVISSCLFGSISGSVIANVATTGQVTIPLMKKAGYPAVYAGAIEAVASTGGVIMPPVMGAAAFVMSEFTGVPYLQILKHALVPALLYYIAIYFMVHFAARKRHILSVSEFSSDKMKQLARRSFYFIPIVLMILVLMRGYSPTKAVLYGMASTIVVSFFRKETRMTPRKILEALEEGGRGAISVAMTCATAGIVVGVVSFTGLGNRISGSLFSLAQNNMMLALVMTAIAAIILGMGLPTTPSYIIVASLIAPTLVKMGMPMIVAHMFVFYFANISNITPPVALAAYTAAGLSKASPMKTGYTAFRLGIAAYVVPFMFAFNPALLLIDVTPLKLVQVIATALAGVLLLAIAMEGCFKVELPLWQRGVVLVCALLLIDTGLGTDVVGIGLGAAMLGLNYMSAKQQAGTVS